MAEEETASRAELLGTATEGRAEGQATSEGERFGDVFSGTGASRMSPPPPSPPPLREWPSERPSPSGSDPRGSNPMRNPIVNHWVAVFKAQGRRGLQEEFYKFAQKRLDRIHLRSAATRRNERFSWEILLKDKSDRTYLTASLLALLPDKVILALLQGELPIQCREDPDIRRFVVKHMQPQETPGIYVNLLHDVDFLWLTSQGVETLIARLERYLEVEPTGQPRADQKAVDTQFDAWNPPERGLKLRWLQGESHRAEAVIREWIDVTREIYCLNPVDDARPFRMGPAEVGWSANVQARCRQHKINSSTTYIWGLLNAICRSSTNSGGFAFPNPMQLVLFPLWERDEMLCKVGEIVGSLLCSSYWYLGGLDCFHAGSFVWDEEGSKPEHDLRPMTGRDAAWDSNVRRVNERMRFIKPLEEIMAKSQRLQNLRALSKRYDDAKAELEGLNQELNEARDKHEAQKAQIEALEAKINAAPAAPVADRYREAMAIGQDLIRGREETEKQWTDTWDL
ncbi:MAG: hypothetical protein HETSPECPRED_002051 [Heterodermia speciosa]|uniref:Uncharacterized protein n=1 Tax=Heterodermia speciosa TaxID=116794 RepID=A0A8H3EWB5_9LECA|nr:MAG: hypothetical protein HETSPECPRED_002051 [Heterodermia speciosa]